MCFAIYKEEPGVVCEGDVGGGIKIEGWAVGVKEDRNVGVHGDVTGERSGSGMLAGG